MFAGRFDRARALANETLAAVDLKNMMPAAKRLLTLADEFPVSERDDAASVHETARGLNQVADKFLPPNSGSDHWRYMTRSPAL